MPRRLALSLLIAWLAWIPTVSAQGPGPLGPPGPGYYGMAPGGPYPGNAGPAYSQRPIPYDELIPANRVPSGDFDLVSDLFHQTWFRTEYLWLNYKEPGSQFLGAQPLVIPPATFDPTATFTAVTRAGGVRVFQEGKLVDLGDVSNRDNNGLRFTIGIPTQLFTLEASAFALGQAESRLFFPSELDVNSAVGTFVYPAIPLTQNGLPSDVDYILFDQGMDVRVRSNLQGTDAKIVFGAVTPNVAVEVAPMIGFNYIHFENRVLLRGSDSATATDHIIDSRANNNIFGPEIGLRMESRSKWMTLGFEPKFTFGINRMGNKVGTHQIYSSAFVTDPITGLPTTTLVEPDRLTKDGLTRFSPVIELGTYARFNLSENLNLSIGYQFMATTNMSLAEQNIVWDAPLNLNDPPQISLTQKRDEFWMQGINVGLQWQF